MAFRLPRLRTEQLTDETGKPTQLFIRWWQSFVSKIEDNTTATQSVLDGLTGVSGSITGLQPYDATLVGLAALDTSTGLVEQIGTTSFTKRGVGITNASDVPTRGNADTRYVKTGAVSAAAAVASTNKMAWTDPSTGTVYYFLMTT